MRLVWLVGGWVGMLVFCGVDREVVQLGRLRVRYVVVWWVGREVGLFGCLVGG